VTGFRALGQRPAAPHASARRLALAFGLAVAVVMGGMPIAVAGTATDPDDVGGRLDLRRIAATRDATTGTLTVTVTTWGSWPEDVLRATGSNRLTVSVDVDVDGVADALVRILRSGGRLLAQVRIAGQVAEQVAATRPGPRRVRFALPEGSAANPAGLVGVAAGSRFRGAGCRPCSDRAPDDGWLVVEPAPGGSGEFTCTQVIGFSQTRQWFLGVPDFEDIVGSDGWQLLWESSAGVDRWADPDYRGWSNAVDSPCASRADDPDRVLLTISMDEFQDDASVWESQIEAAIATIRDKFDNLQQIVLQPVIGGPNHDLSLHGGDPVRASSNHPVIDAAIADVVGGDVVAGASPEVRTCDDYADAIGHLEGDARSPISQLIAAFYD
jgi:hypothetical protein